MDPNLQRNAGAFGTVNRTRAKYVQIGKGTDFRFCKQNLSPIRAALQPEYYQPQLLVLSFPGNTTKRWATSPATARADVAHFMAEIPKNQACVFMTTAPSFKPSENRRRLPAQASIKAAFAPF